MLSTFIVLLIGIAIGYLGKTAINKYGERVLAKNPEAHVAIDKAINKAKPVVKKAVQNAEKKVATEVKKIVKKVEAKKEVKAEEKIATQTETK